MQLYIRWHVLLLNTRADKCKIRYKYTQNVSYVIFRLKPEIHEIVLSTLTLVDLVNTIYIDENLRSIIHFCIGQLKITMKVLILLAVVIGNIFTLNTCILHFLQHANGTRIIFI